MNFDESVKDGLTKIATKGDDDGPVKFSTPCAELFAALATAQAAIETPKRTKTAKVVHKSGGGQHSYNYADLASIREACREPLKAAGLAVVQSATTDDAGRVVMTTLITHASGQWLISGPLRWMPDKGTPQGLGSAITYMKRYAISAALNIAMDEDDDGASAEKGTKEKKSAPQAAPKRAASGPLTIASKSTITPAQQKELWKQATARAESLDKTGETLMRDLLAHMQVDATAAIPASEYLAAVEAILKWDPEVEFGA